jgi:cellulose synthase operon protein C
MTSTTKTGSAQAASPAHDSALVLGTIARLRSEHGAATTPAREAVLLHEIGVLEEALGDEAAAARDQLAAVNAEPEFTEPLERLIAIIERRQSYKNLGKLLDRLVKVAATPTERVRALVEHAFFVLDQEGDAAAAQALVEQAVDEVPSDVTAWLALEVLALRSGDLALEQRSLAQRAALAQLPEWRALLLLDLATLRAKAGDEAGAEAAVDEAVSLESPATFLALLRAEGLAKTLNDVPLQARFLEAQASLAFAAVKDAEKGDATGVPRDRRTPAHAADAWLRAADAHRRNGQGEKAIELLDRALGELPGDPSLTRARLVAAEAAGDSETMARLARSELEQGASGELAAALWLRVAEAAAARADGAGALDAVRRALKEDAKSVPARALELDLLSTSNDAPALATALEALAERVTNERSRAGLYLVAADAWARLAKDPQGARAALSQAGMSGATPSLVARIGRLLAASIDDATWYEESTRRVIGQGAPSDEQLSLWFELGRARTLRGDRAGAEQAFEAIAEVPGGSFLGNALLAFVRELIPARTDHEGAGPATTAWAPLVALAKEEQDPELARAARTAAALRALHRGDREAARELLATLHDDDPADVVTAVALSRVHAIGTRHLDAARPLLAAANATTDRALGASLRIEAGLLAWRGGDRNAALEAFELAADASDPAGGPMAAWALRAADPNNIDARRRALEASETNDGLSSALERFTLEVGPGGQEAPARAALARAVMPPTTGPGLALVLALALWEGTERAKRAAALDTLAEQSAPAAALARAAAFELELAQARDGRPDPAETEAAAARWAEVEGSTAAALEWLSAAIAKNDVPAEVAARRLLARRLGGTGGEALAASGSIAAWLTGIEEPPPLEGASPWTLLANVELAPPGTDPQRRGEALARAGAHFGDDSLGVTQALAGYNQLAAGSADAALVTFRAVVEAAPQEIIGWEGLRAAAELTGDRGIVAEASAALGDAVNDDARGGELWEHAATILMDELGDKDRGELALSRAVQRDVKRHAAFDRLFRIVRAKKDGPRLLELITRRLDVAEDPEEIAKLFWERARVMRGSGDREGALAALENVRMLEPDHVGALALSGEIYLTLQRFEEAAEQLGRLSGLAEAPAQQRLMSGVAAVDIYENKLKDLAPALDILTSLQDAHLGTPQVRERLARVAAKAGAWERAASTFEILMNEREAGAGRAEAARLALAIRRDRLGNPASARTAAAQLLAELPGDGEALDLVLSGAFSSDFARPLLEAGRLSIACSFENAKAEVETVERLARIALALGDDPLRQASLGALVALGVEPGPLDAELAKLDRRVARVPSIAIDDASIPDLADPEDGGAIASLMRELGTTIAEAIGPNLSALGVTKKERVDPKAGHPIRNEIVAWAGALGIGELEVYVGGRDPGAVFGVATETPSMIVGEGVRAPLSPAYRQAVARELFALRRGTTVLGHREAPEVSALIVAACRLGGVELEAPAFAMLAEFQRLLGKEMPRRVKKLLPDLARNVADSGEDLLRFYRAATSSLDRMAAVAAGDVSWVLAGDARNRGRQPASLEGEERMQRLLGFVLSRSYLELRERLGMGVR